MNNKRGGAAHCGPSPLKTKLLLAHDRQKHVLLNKEKYDEERYYRPREDDVQRTADHTITLLNSLVSLIDGVRLLPNEVHDSDRMRVRSATQAVCESFGIKVNFPEQEAMDRQTPLRWNDMTVLIQNRRMRQRAKVIRI